ncbi:MAG: PCMD domain-containing protein, partial [Dysgonamonadaceae bacterium]|nr:PCMD domain-containing protein [Dysgonamonadaceae bacterium]
RLLLTLTVILFVSCIKDDVLNPEADIVSVSFTENRLRTKNVEIYNDYIVVYPKLNADLKKEDIASIELSEGASYQSWDNTISGDTLFFIDVTSQSKEYAKTYSVVQVKNFPQNFEFETWVKPGSSYLYENPKEGSLQWYSSNNGVAMAWNNSVKPANEYPVRQIRISGNTAVELCTMTGPGKIAGGIVNIPCLAGSLYLGGFNPLMGLSNPLKSTQFGIPFNSGKPLKLSGKYIYKEGSEDYINEDGSRDATKKDKCSIYAVLFKTDDNAEFLYGDNVSNAPNIIARAELDFENIRRETDFIDFEVDFDYRSYSVPFVWNELENNEYKLTIVFASSYRGGNYEGRPGNTLIIDDIKLLYEVKNE